MVRTDRLAIARAAILLFPSWVRAAGTYEAAQPRMPAHWTLTTDSLSLILTEGVLLAPDEPALSSLLVVWREGKGKVLSVSWSPTQPWLPPTVIAFKPADWPEILKSVPAAEGNSNPGAP